MTQTQATDEATTEPGLRRWLPRVVLAAALVAVVVVAVLVLGGDDGAEPTLSDLPDEPVAGVDGEGSELLDLLAAGQELTFHATYAAPAAAEGGELQVEIWRDGGSVRQDSVISLDGQTARTAAIREPDGTVTSCLQRGDEAWACGAADGAPEDDLFGSVAQQLTGAEVTVTDETVAGHDARCFAIADATGSSELCVTTEGIPVRIAAGEEAVMEITELEREVDPSVFTPPAEATEA